MENLLKDLKTFYKGRKVFITGHTGFKGVWLSLLLNYLGAEVSGYALNPTSNMNLFDLSNLNNIVDSRIGDVRNYFLLENTINELKPEIIFHLAAQPLVIESYNDPHYTYETNIMGTLNILEIMRKNQQVKSLVNVTTDKVYKNKEWIWGYREFEELDGHDPYSNSKSCSELITRTYARSFFKDISISTVRAGNVIGGGDFSENRIIPDCIRAILNNNVLELRNPDSVRPYQHVLEPLFVYILLAYKQFDDNKYSGSYNVGPDVNDCVTNMHLIELFNKHSNNRLKYKFQNDYSHKETNYLRLDNSKMKNALGFKPKWTIDNAVIKTIDWMDSFIKDPNNVLKTMNKQIEDYLNEG